MNSETKNNEESWKVTMLVCLPTVLKRCQLPQVEMTVGVGGSNKMYFVCKFA